MALISCLSLSVPFALFRPITQSRPGGLGVSVGKGNGKTLSHPRPSPGVAVLLELHVMSLVFGMSRLVLLLLALRAVIGSRACRWGVTCVLYPESHAWVPLSWVSHSLGMDRSLVSHGTRSSEPGSQPFRVVLGSGPCSANGGQGPHPH